MKAGAVAIVTDLTGAQLIGSASVPVLIVDNPRAFLGDIAAAVYRHPARDLLMFAVTGTNGKTTTTYLLESGLRAAGHLTGLIGTVETRIGPDRIPSIHTTPEASDVHAILAVMRERRVTACAMEVSSHAMAFGRVDGIMFDMVGFTNLTQDHLDFHANFDDYFAAKAELFSPERAHRAVVVAGDEYGRRLVEHPRIPTAAVFPRDAPSFDVALPAREAPHFDVDHGLNGLKWGSKGDLAHDQRLRGRRWHVEQRSDRVLLTDGSDNAVELQVSIPGQFNVTNAALAAAMLVEAGIDPATVTAGIANCRGVPGRMEPITSSNPTAPTAIVDYAHTPDAIHNVLGALDPPGRLVVVIGGGGDRDRDKRPRMGEAAARGADVVVVTDDNPRSEDATSIRAAILAGARSGAARPGTQIIEVAGRRAAIRTAVALAAGPGDMVVVLGKGHEQGQEIAGVVHPFDDRDVLREELDRTQSSSRDEMTGQAGRDELDGSGPSRDERDRHDVGPAQ
jgi:UDP-N-acetylmuramoyl-L-alanyl-D-glutamate--2,6-diaminopimelate ligase